LHAEIKVIAARRMSILHLKVWSVKLVPPDVRF